LNCGRDVFNAAHFRLQRGRGCDIQRTQAASKRHRNGENFYNPQPPRLGVNPGPIQIEARESGDVAHHPQLRPLMLGRVDAQDQQQVFPAQCAQRQAIDIQLDRTREQGFHVEVDRVEARHNLPLHLH